MYKFLQSILLIYVLNCNSFAAIITTNNTINSIGYYIKVASISGLSSKYSAMVTFKKPTDTNWRLALTPVRQTINSEALIIGSILQLDAASTYEIKATIYDSISLITNIVTLTTTTTAEPVIPVITDTLWVDSKGIGNLFSRTQPGKFDDLFNSYPDKVTCNKIIICKGGLYNVGDLQYNTRACTDLSKPIIIQSAPGEIAIFDGSDTSNSTRFPAWQVYDASNSIYKTSLPSSVAFSTLFRYDGVRLFPYAAIYNTVIPPLNTNYWDVLNNCSSFYGSGFYRNGNQFYIKLANSENPNGHEITVSRHNVLLHIYKNSTDSRFVFKNLTFRNYGKANMEYAQYWDFSCWCWKPNYNQILNEYGATVFDIRNISNCLFDSCNFEYNTTSIYFQCDVNGNCDNTIIQNCTFKDNTGLWNHAAYKNSDLVNKGDISTLLDNGKFGRNLQTNAILFNYANSSIKDVIIRKNKFVGLVATAGIKGNSDNPKPAYDCDFYENTINNC